MDRLVVRTETSVAPSAGTVLWRTGGATSAIAVNVHVVSSRMPGASLRAGGTDADSY